jgi:hypothetical protein
MTPRSIRRTAAPAGHAMWLSPRHKECCTPATAHPPAWSAGALRRAHGVERSGPRSRRRSPSTASMRDGRRRVTGTVSCCAIPGAPRTGLRRLCRQRRKPAVRASTSPTLFNRALDGMLVGLAARGSSRGRLIKSAGQGEETAPGSGAVVAHLLWGQAVAGSNPASPTTRPPRPRSRGCSSTVELQPSKLATRVRFPSPARRAAGPEGVIDGAGPLDRRPRQRVDGRPARLDMPCGCTARTRRVEARGSRRTTRREEDRTRSGRPRP